MMKISPELIKISYAFAIVVEIILHDQFRLTDARALAAGKTLGTRQDAIPNRHPAKADGGAVRSP